MLSCSGIQRMSSMLAAVWVPLVALLALLPAWFLMTLFNRSQLLPTCVLALLTSALLFGRLQHIWVLVGKWGIRQHRSGHSGLPQDASVSSIRRKESDRSVAEKALKQIS